MKHLYFLGIILATILAGCGSGSTDSSSTTGENINNTTPGTTVQCREIEPILKTLNRKYASSKDAYNTYDSLYSTYKGSKGSGDSDGKGSNDEGGSHNEGRNCLACHNFASAGTVFTTLNAPDNTPGAAGYRIKLSDGTVYGSARGTGNSRAYTFPSGKFTAQVIDPNGNVVNSSMEMSHDGSRRACNSCHSATGNNGAPGRITSAKLSSSAAIPSAPAVNNCVSFSSNVMPILEARCKSCHGSNGNFMVTTANATHANISALSGGAQYLLDKANNTVGHGGGSVISTSSPEYTTIKAWITEGALNN